jgi:hypothetical protein
MEISLMVKSPGATRAEQKNGHAGHLRRETEMGNRWHLCHQIDQFRNVGGAAERIATAAHKLNRSVNASVFETERHLGVSIHWGAVFAVDPVSVTAARLRMATYPAASPPRTKLDATLGKIWASSMTTMRIERQSRLVMII